MWISVKNELPPMYHRVLVCRELHIEGLEHVIKVCDIAHLEGHGPTDRWRLDSQQFSLLPCAPTLESGIISHWMRLPGLPKTSNTNKKGKS